MSTHVAVIISKDPIILIVGPQFLKKFRSQDKSRVELGWVWGFHDKIPDSPGGVFEPQSLQLMLMVTFALCTVFVFQRFASLPKTNSKQAPNFPYLPPSKKKKKKS